MYQQGQRFKMPSTPSRTLVFLFQRCLLVNSFQTATLVGRRNTADIATEHLRVRVFRDRLALFKQTQLRENLRCVKTQRLLLAGSDLELVGRLGGLELLLKV
jgi:hypothetical protein